MTLHIHRRNCHPSIWLIWLIALGLECEPFPIECLTVNVVTPTTMI